MVVADIVYYGFYAIIAAVVWLLKGAELRRLTKRGSMRLGMGLWGVSFYLVF